MAAEPILIADENMGRAKRVATALEASGHGCRVVSHGAAALEAALASAPRVIVAQAELPLVESTKLAEILRANPRTRGARFLFLGVPQSRVSQYCGVGDETLPAGAATDEIHDRVEILLERQERIALLDERAGTEREFEGALSELCPAELLQMLHVRGSTGRLTLTPELEDGARPDGWILVREGEIGAAMTGAAEAEKALYRMLDWRMGDFHFEPFEASDEFQASPGARILAPTRSVLAEGLRQLDEWNRLAPKLPPFESPVKVCVEEAELPHVVHPLTQEVLEALESADRVSDVVDHCRRPDYQVLRTLQTLADRGLIEIGRARIAPPESISPVLFNEAQTRRLRAFAQEGLARDEATPDVKLLVVTANTAVGQDFGDLLAKVPGAELAPRFERGQIDADDLEVMARIEVDSDFGLDLIHVPSAPAFAPLWPLASRSSLGTLFLLDARMGVSAAGLADVVLRMGGLPSARTFHVVLLAEGERLSPDELRANLSLIDEASLFLLPVESGKDPSSLLRSLFARIVP